MRLQPETRDLLKRARDEDGPVGNLQYTLGETVIACEVREGDAGFVAKRSDLHRLRQSIRRYNGLSGIRLLIAPSIEWTVNTVRRITLSLLRRSSAGNPAKTVDRRTLAPRGIVVALMGPMASASQRRRHASSGDVPAQVPVHEYLPRFE
ncbi:MAG: hypothetical protein O9293_10885 [Porphyrobacter sp.]|nr:hypothetical protein [Porphyrobacter sp.]